MDFKKELSAAIAKAVGDDAHDMCTLVETPPNPEMGDFALPCFRLAKTMRKAPNAIAAELSNKIELPAFIERMETSAAYLNFYLNKEVYARDILGKVLSEKEDYGKANVGEGRTVCVEYSSPNIAKPFHIGHLRTTVIGQALNNMYSFIGYKTVAINHLGDWGTQFGKMIVAYRNWGNKEDIEAKGIPELNRIYVLFHEKAEEDPSLEDEARAWFIKMQNGDEEALSIWKWFVSISLNEFNRVYDILNVHFDHYTGESFYNDKMNAVVDELKEKNMLTESQGAMIVDLEPYGLPPAMILKSDGGTLYATRDMATAFYRKKTYDFVKSLYIVGAEQSLYFQQLIKTIEVMGHDWAHDMVHIPFGLVRLEAGKLSTRKGNVVLLDEIITEAISRTKEIIDDKNPGLENKGEVAKQVGVGAIIFNDLYNNRIKAVTFSWSKILSFDGETGPYVQYTHARACSVLEKAGVSAANMSQLENADYGLLTDDASFEVIKLLAIFSDKVVEAATKYEPYIVTRYLIDVAQAFNKFYHDNAVLSSEEALKNARLVLVYGVKTVLNTGLKLLGIGSPEKM